MLSLHIKEYYGIFRSGLYNTVSNGTIYVLLYSALSSAYSTGQLSVFKFYCFCSGIPGTFPSFNQKRFAKAKTCKIIKEILIYCSDPSVSSWRHYQEWIKYNKVII